jgi:hypothetical protein
MNYQWRSKEAGRITYVDSPSGASPFLIRSSLQDAIRPGTVASRVQSIQKLASPSPPRSHPPPISIPCGEDSRIGFGRRINNRFGKPALQNTNPDEEPHIETAHHSYLGLNTPRVTHEAQHAIANHGTKYARSSGINGQIIPDGIIERTQHDAVAPWGVLSRSNRTRSMGRHISDQETDIQSESNFTRTQRRYTVESSRFRSDEKTRYLDLYRRNLESRPGDTIDSEASNATSSTTRRQSVRDLFKDFGIERPAGLASRGTSYETGDISRLVREHRQCHVCSRVNTSLSITCSRCNHKLCLQCDALPPLPGTREKEAVGNKKRGDGRKDPASKENWSIDRGPVKQSNLRPTKPRKEVAPSSQEIRNPLPKLPDMQTVDLFALQKKPPRTLKQEKAFPEEPLAIPFLSGSRAPRRVRDSPFLQADLLASGRSLPLRQAKAPAKNDTGQKSAQNHRLKKLVGGNGVSSSSDGNKCSSSTCRATHHGHQPYRHAVSCIKKKRHRHANKYTDKGYSADTSRVEDTVPAQPKTISHTTEHRGRHSHKAKLKSGLTRISGSSGLDSQPPSEQEGSEFVECHGYPRTGHSRLGSPVSSGIVGECQHCLHDCHCTACKSTYHSVRCCVHGDHQAMVHHHLTPQKGTSVISEKEPTKVKPNSSDKPGPYKSVAVVSPSFEQKVLTVTTKSTEDSARQDQPPEKRPLVNMHSLPRTKQSSLMANNFAKPPTPPPWVSSPRKQSISGIATVGRRQERRGEDVEPVFSIKPPEDPPPSFNKSPPPAPSIKDVPENYYPQRNDALATLRALYEHDNEQRRASHRPLSRSMIIEKPSRPPSTRPPSRMQVSPPGSRRASRRLSALFQLRERNSVPLLNQKLLDHQEELRRTQRECEHKLEGVVRRLEDFTLGNEGRESDRNVRHEEKERVDIVHNRKTEEKVRAEAAGSVRRREKQRSETVRKENPEEKNRAESIKSDKTATPRKKSWRIRLVDRRSSPACVNDKPVAQHRLVDDEPITLNRGKKSLVSFLETPKEPQQIDSEDHDCVWKSRLLEVEQDERLGIQGVTVLLHFERREDVVFKAVDWMGGELRIRD